MNYETTIGISQIITNKLTIVIHFFHDNFYFSTMEETPSSVFTTGYQLWLTAVFFTYSVLCDV